MMPTIQGFVKTLPKDFRDSRPIKPLARQNFLRQSTRPTTKKPRILSLPADSPKIVYPTQSEVSLSHPPKPSNKWTPNRLLR